MSYNYYDSYDPCDQCDSYCNPCNNECNNSCYNQCNNWNNQCDPCNNSCNNPCDSCNDECNDSCCNPCNNYNQCDPCDNYGCNVCDDYCYNPCECNSYNNCNKPNSNNNCCWNQCDPCCQNPALTTCCNTRELKKLVKKILDTLNSNSSNNPNNNQNFNTIKEILCNILKELCKTGNKGDLKKVICLLKELNCKIGSSPECNCASISQLLCTISKKLNKLKDLQSDLCVSKCCTNFKCLPGGGKVCISFKGSNVKTITGITASFDKGCKGVITIQNVNEACVIYRASFYPECSCGGGDFELTLPHPLKIKQPFNIVLDVCGTPCNENANGSLNVFYCDKK